MLVKKNIKYLRKKSGDSQENWGKKFNLSRGMVDSYERGTAKPNVPTAQAICDAYKISLDDFYSIDLSNTMQIEASQSNSEIMKLKDQLIKTQEQLIEDLRNTIKRLEAK